MRGRPEKIREGALSYREFVEAVTADCRAAMNHPDRPLQPEGDVPPRFYMTGGGHLWRQILDWEWFSSRESKDLLVEAFTVMIHALGVKQFAWCTTQYLVIQHFEDPEEWEKVRASKEMPEGQPMPSEHPDRIEVFAAHIYDAEHLESWFAPITRENGMPKFGEWNDLPGADGQPQTAPAEGLMTEPIQEAIRS